MLCPGQGAQAVGMAKAWFDESPEARAVFERAEAVLAEVWGADPSTAGLATLSTLCFEGPEATLNRTDVSQPAIYVSSVACLAGVKARLGFGNGEMPVAATAGLSLGEYTALHVAGAFSFEDGLRLVALRGRAMQDAAEQTASGMVALIGADPKQAEALCGKALEQSAEEAPKGSVEVLVSANFNAPGQIVVSGTAAACKLALAVADEMGLRATPLPVAGAFHSPVMAPAAERLGEALAHTAIAQPRCPVMSNVTAEPHAPSGAGTMADAIRLRLAEQLTSPVRWAECCQWLIGNAGRLGGSEFVEPSPGRTLGGLMRRIDRGTKVTSYDDPAKLD